MKCPPPNVPMTNCYQITIYIYIYICYPPPLQHVTIISLKTAHKHLNVRTHPKKKKKNYKHKFLQLHPQPLLFGCVSLVFSCYCKVSCFCPGTQREQGR